MTEFPLYIVAVDPGLSSGVAFGVFRDAESAPELLASGEVPVEDVVPWVRKHLDMNPNSMLVCESFTISLKTAKNSQAPWSLEHIGALKQEMRDRDGDLSRFRLQSPGNAKSIFPNPVLKGLGLWHVGGKGHALDAIRHMCLGGVGQNWKAESLIEDDED